MYWYPVVGYVRFVGSGAGKKRPSFMLERSDLVSYAVYISPINGNLYFISYQKPKHDDHQHTANPYSLFQLSMISPIHGFRPYRVYEKEQSDDCPCNIMKYTHLKNLFKGKKAYENSQ